MRIGSDSRLSASRSSSSDSTRRSIFCSLCAWSVDSAWRAFSSASSCRRRFSPRSAVRTSTRAPRFSERNSASAERSPASRGTMICGGTLGADAVVLEAERLEHRRQILPADVLDVERVAVDHLAAAEREDLHDGAVAFGREADHVDGPDRLPVGALPLDEVLHGVQPVAVARRLLEPLVLGGRAHLLLELALDRLHVAGEELDHAVDDRAGSPPCETYPTHGARQRSMW